MTNIYFVVSAIITASGYIGNIWLLITIYALAYHCFTQPDGKPGSTSKKGILRAHYVLCGILFALFLATFAFQIRDVVVQVQDYGLYYTRIRRSIPVSYKLDVAYDALTFVASVEILIGSLWGVVRSRGQGQPLKVRQTSESRVKCWSHQLTVRKRKPGILFLTLVAFPFFIRRVIVLGFDAAFELSLTRYATAGAYLAQTIVVGFAIVVSFVGIILVVKELEKNSVPPGWNPDGFAPNGQPPSNGPMNGYPQGYGYPQTQPFGYYPQGQGPPPNMQYANAQSQQQQQGYPSHLQSQHHQADSPRTQQGDTSQPQQQQQQHHAGPDTGLAVPPSSTSGATATATNEMSADEQQTPELYNQNQQQRRLYEMNS